MVFSLTVSFTSFWHPQPFFSSSREGTKDASLLTSICDASLLTSICGSCFFLANITLNPCFSNFFPLLFKTAYQKVFFTFTRKSLFKCPYCHWVMGLCIVSQRKYTFAQFWIIYSGFINFPLNYLELII